ncbi:MAG: hypothetical protein R2864_02805, partial [Syntrophotaleaceae bacterium]
MSLKWKKHQRSLALIVIIAGLILLAAGSTLWLRGTRQQRQTEALNQQIAAINRLGLETVDPQQLHDLIVAAEQRRHILPEAEYAQLQHQWLQAVATFDRLRNTLANPYLAERARSSAAIFHTQLLQLRDTASESLTDPQRLPPEWQWKIHTLRGNVAVLLAYSVLYHEQDGRKAAKLLGDALEDYKTAIDQVDRVSLSSAERVLPRWNLELIVAVGQYRRIGLSEIP